VIAVVKHVKVRQQGFIIMFALLVSAPIRMLLVYYRYG
jgi:hypothetical protein